MADGHFMFHVIGGQTAFGKIDNTIPIPTKASGRYRTWFHLPLQSQGSNSVAAPMSSTEVSKRAGDALDKGGVGSEKRPRLDQQKPTPFRPKHADDDDANSDPRASVAHNSDLLSRIAALSASLATVHSLCVAVGPTKATHIRRDWLHNNDAYLVKSLESLKVALFGAKACQGGKQRRILSFLRYLSCRNHFDKCRDNIRAWMSINTDWRSRCTSDGLSKCRNDTGFRPSTVMKAELIFNNPTLVVELGLVEVFEHLVEELKICLYKNRQWNGFVYGSDITLCKLALHRGEVSFIEPFLSSESFSRGSDTAHYSLLLRIVENDCIGIDAFKAIISHPLVDIHDDGRRNGQVLPNDTAFSRAVLWLRYEAQPEIQLLRVQKIMALLDAGADPLHYHTGVHGVTPLASAEESLRRNPGSVLWREVKEKVEERAAFLFQMETTSKYTALRTT